MAGLCLHDEETEAWFPAAPSESIVSVFDTWARQEPHREAVVGRCLDSDVHRLTWAELRNTSVAAAEILLKEARKVESDVELIGLLAKRSPMWLAVTIGILRCGKTFVWMGAGELPKRSRYVEAARNKEIVTGLQPGLVVILGTVEEEVVPDWSQPAPHVLRLSPAALAPFRNQQRTGGVCGTLSPTLCYMLTGGTTGNSKCVEVTHTMSLHEAQAYPYAAPKLGVEDRVLQQTPVLWAATAWGQVDIAMAFGATLCITDGLDQDTVISQQATVLGVVPSSLESLDPKVVPSVRCIFTWGEALTPVAASRWRGSGIDVYELLISTEYWLSLVSQGDRSATGRTIYRILEGVQVAVLPPPEDGHEGQRALSLRSDPGAHGELCLRGPMVTPGYRPMPGRDVPGETFVASNGSTFFRTKDLVTLRGSSRGRPESLEFCGRSDQLVKVAGQFVDLSAAERSLSQALLGQGEVNGHGHQMKLVAEVSILPPLQSVQSGPTIPQAAAHAFVAVGAEEGLRCSAKAAAAFLAAVRAHVPRGAALHIVSGPLPKDPVTGKVNRREVMAGVTNQRTLLPAWPGLWERLKLTPAWWTFLALPGLVDVPALVAKLAFLIGLSSTDGRYKPLVWPRLAAHILAVPYLWLASIYSPKRVLRRVTNYIIFGRVGLLSLLYYLARRGDKYPTAARVGKLVLAAGTLLGVLIAKRSQRLLPWLGAFWLSIPDSIEGECGYWMKLEGYKWLLEQLMSVNSSTFKNACNFCCKVILDLPEFSSLFYRLVHAQLAGRPPYRAPSELLDLPASTASSCGGLSSESASFPCSPVLEHRPPPIDISLSEPAPGSFSAINNMPSGPEGWKCEKCGERLSDNWRQEDKSFYCKPCFKAMDDEWWDGVNGLSRDTIDRVIHPQVRLEEFPPWDGQQQSGRLPGTPAKARSAAGTQTLQLLQKQLGTATPSVEESLSGVDSLAVLSLCRNLCLAVPGLQLRPQDVFECSCVGDLLSLVEERAEAAKPPRDDTAVASTSGGSSSSSRSSSRSGADQLGDSGDERAIWFASGQYCTTCKWLYGCRGLLDEQRFRQAAARLIARHEGLRAEFVEGDDRGLELLKFLKDAATVYAALWNEADAATARRGGPMGRLLRGIIARLCRFTAWSFKGSWPRVAAAQLSREFLQERVLVFRVSSWEEVESVSNTLRESFKPPGCVALILVESNKEAKNTQSDAQKPEEWGAPSSFVQFVWSHAFSDGYTNVPLIQDLSALYAQAGGHQDMTAALVPLPRERTFEVLESRFFEALECKPKYSHPEQMSLRATCFDGPSSKRSSWWYTHEVLLEKFAVDELRVCSTRYKIPFDVLLLSVCLSAGFRATELNARRRGAPQGQQADVLSMPLTLYSPMRDGDLNQEMVGLFSDWRDANVQCTSTVTLLGFCLELADLIRHRRWTVFDPIQNSEQILVNILGLDEQVRGGQRFQQTRKHEYGSRRTSEPWKRKSKRETGARPMRLTLEQEAQDAWWISMELSADHFPTSWCRIFVKQLESSLQDLVYRPLVPVRPRARGERDPSRQPPAPAA